ncbi:MAG: TolC family protein [Candidatus Dadabacteria bacterium]|nr:MAG: TolC family protein [Candidatus Dadabacteria bacterium]
MIKITITQHLLMHNCIIASLKRVSVSILLLLSATAISMTALPANLQAEAQAPLVKLTLSDSIISALKNNPLILSLEIAPALAKQDKNFTKGRLDTIITTEASVGRDKSPATSSILGSTFETRDRKASLTIEKTFLSGTTAALKLEASRIESNSRATTLNPAWQSRLFVELRQPLLKGAWSGRPAEEIKVKDLVTRAEKYRYRDKLEKEIFKIVKSYWELKYAAIQKKIRKENLLLARKLLGEARAMVKAGQKAQDDLNQTKAQLASRQDQLQQAKNDYNIKLTNLQTLTGLAGDLLKSSVILLTDTPQIDSFNPAADQLLKTALRDRSDFVAAELRLKAEKLRVEIAENQTLPELELRAQAGLEGLAGVPRDTDFGTGISSQFAGESGDSFDRLASGDFPNYTIGVTLSRSLENRKARSRLETARLKLRQASLNALSLKQQIIAEVKNALSGLNSARQRIKASKMAVKHMELALNGATEKFKEGLLSTRDLLEFQSDLIESRLGLKRALIDYEIATAETRYASGQLGKYFGIEFG